jgi:hypothetical protein
MANLQNVVRTLSLVLVLVGALNWGLVGALDLDLVKLIGKHTAPVVATVLYILVGVSAVVYTVIIVKQSAGTERFTANTMGPSSHYCAKGLHWDNRQNKCVK